MSEPVPDPELGAALVSLELADLRLRPWWAAHWVAAGLGGERLAELAGLGGVEREVSDLWPLALAELGVATPVVGARRTAAPWMARQVLEGRRDLPWLQRELWPYREDTTDDDEALDGVVYAVDELLGLLERAELARRPPRRRRGLLWRGRVPEVSEQQERESRALVDAVVVALADGGVEAAAAVLDARSAGTVGGR
ncbi:hypothetical protein FHN55_02610 [Streptomyces sp. NP160]|uniref:hypothetical protein n=1 Tax=Streptomyces sp. NP160 TaxID=2586637 RepID=UPI00111ADB39|nr:hypothetical protein [Streptomyces sp. NP160]TNM69658.1 hypothetical protein FHN55_02610 [Streptomyces sp. NP160]